MAVLILLAPPVRAEQQSLFTSQIYYSIDISEAVLASRINQKVSGDCAVVSMATVESYLYGVTSDAEKDVIYNTLISANGDNDYAYWYRCGFGAYDYIDWTTVYNQLAAGYPVLVHHPGTSSMRQHWSVVAGYFGSATTLEKDKFIIVDVNHGNSTQQIYTSEQWRKGTTIDRMVVRKNGLTFDLEGIRIAVNTPVAAHQLGRSHGVYGTIISDAKLTSVQVMITNASTGEHIYNNTVFPNDKTYCINALDKGITFGKYPEGEYFYTVIAKTETAAAVRQKYFRICSGWPGEEPTRRYSVATEGGEEITVAYGDTFALPTAPVKEGYTFKGWSVKRDTDDQFLLTEHGENLLLDPGATVNLDYSWIQDCLHNTGYTLIANWEKDQPITSPKLPVLGDANGDGKVNLKDWAMLFDHINEISLLTDDALSRVDINGDGKVNAKDWSLLYTSITE